MESVFKALSKEYNSVKNNQDANVAEKLAPISKAITDNNSKITALRDANKDKTLSEDDNANIKSLEEAVKQLRDEETALLSTYASSQSTIKQLVDLALLSNGLLKGEELNSFINRSIALL